MSILNSRGIYPKDLAPEILNAYHEAHRRGLPDGWTCTIDKRNRRKWTAPNNGRSCDSIPKALQISVDLGLLPPDTKIESGKRKRTSGGSSSAANKKRRRRQEEKRKRRRGRPPKLGRMSPSDEEEEEDDDDELKIPYNPPSKQRAPAPAQPAEPDNDDEVDDDDEENLTQPPPGLHPEHALDGRNHPTAPTTVHWDPTSPDGRKVGWRVKVAVSQSTWAQGRVVRYDPYTHKHKLQLTVKEKDHFAWVWIRNDQFNLHLSTRMVWAHVKGYAWWPAFVTEINTPTPGQVHLEFIGSGEVATLRDSPDCIRPFSPDQVDPVVASHRKKRNARAFQLACEEHRMIQQTRNEAALWYARKAALLCDSSKVGKRIQVVRDDYGEPMIGKVRKYSATQNKYLVSFPDKACWLPLTSRTVRILGKRSEPAELTPDVLVPFLVGYKPIDETDEYHDWLNNHCRGCVDPLPSKGLRIVCDVCDAPYHLGCFDPPMQEEEYQRLIRQGIPVVCPQCRTCRGCYQKDITFGCHVLSPKPASLTFPTNEELILCHMCREAYEVERYCPNCAHTWDDVRFKEVRHQLDWASTKEGKKQLRKNNAILQDTQFPLVLGAFSGDDEIPHGLKVPNYHYYQETTEFGMTEVEMLVCDSCGIWVHAGCAGITEEEYEDISEGRHPLYAKEFLCLVCCRKRCHTIIDALRQHDRSRIFAEPVSDKVAPNYHDVIKKPMDLRAMTERANKGDYWNYAWCREMFELMVINALTFNNYYTTVWNEAQRYYHTCLKTVFPKLAKAAPIGRYNQAILDTFKNAEKEHQKEVDRVQIDQTVEKKDLVAGSMAVTVKLPPLRDQTPDYKSLPPFKEVELNVVDAFYCAWMDTCFTCGSSGASDTMLFCVDCGEAFHTFCVNAPIHSMDENAVAGWRCPNCKICEISGEAPSDDTQMVLCEMCDRGFTLGLLDPPLTGAPPGLWICGQCVQCKHCNSKSEQPTLKHWSRFPDKCYRCGGCDGISSSEKCKVSGYLLRPDDEDVVECDTCSAKVHIQCDQLAYDFQQTSASRTQRVTRIKYSCPSCPRSVTFDSLDTEADRTLLMKTLRSAKDCNEEIIDRALWMTSDMWRDEYISITYTGLRILEEAQRVLGEHSIVTQRILAEDADPDVCTSIVQRALRFCRMVKRRSMLHRGCKPASVEQAVLYAKLAASFIEVACRVLKRNISQEVVHHDRVMELLKLPKTGGVFIPPVDPLRYHPVALSEGGIVDINLSLHLRDDDSGDDDMGPNLQCYKLAKPLCGWAEQIGQGRNQSEWRDPRECCLCHICGDVDAGLEDEVPEKAADGEIVFSPMGRLLPLHDGNWVHAACALWSSEVYEDPNDRLVYRVEKARSRGAQLKCFGCGRAGATVGCCKKNCPYNYHFTCAKVCGAVFTKNQRVFCANHQSQATGSILDKESFEHMKPLLVANERKNSSNDTEGNNSDICIRIGALTVHALGDIDSDSDKFHTENYITPPGYVATRIFWSCKTPRGRTLYVLKVFKTADNQPEFAIIPGDDPGSAIRSSSMSIAYSQLMERVRKINSQYISRGHLRSRMPVARRSRKKTFGLNPPQFFGFGVDAVRKKLELCSGVEAVVAQLKPNSASYRFCFTQPEPEAIMALQRKRAAAKAEQALENTSGCARTEGIKAVARSGGSGRITRALVRSAEEVESSAPSTTSKKSDDRTNVDRNHYQNQYRRMKSVPIEERLVARRSHIHGWGLFTKIDIRKHDPIVEYMGEVIRKTISDKRENAYELSGEGSCYMFRLDLQRVVDATKIGSMARFMNHSCQPNAYAKIISVDTEYGADKKIVVFAERDISAGEEITYDYKFPVEDGSLRCTCGAPNCIGRLN